MCNWVITHELRSLNSKVCIILDEYTTEEILKNGTPFRIVDDKSNTLFLGKTIGLDLEPSCFGFSAKTVEYYIDDKWIISTKE